MRPTVRLSLPIVIVTLLLSSIQAEYLHREGYLEPYDLPNYCDQGETHLLWDPCTGESIFVATLIAIYDCKHVHVEGPNVGINSFCPMIDPTAIVEVEPSCWVQVRNLTVGHIPGGHRIHWDEFACTDSFDVIRGTVSSLTSDDLGAVTCLENDRTQSYADDLTGDVPPPGEAFFYLVRPYGPAGFVHYGYSSSGSTRSPAFGDCPLG